MLSQAAYEEIRSQPSVWRAVADRLIEEMAEIDALVDDSDRVVLAGCGSSYYCGVVTAELLRAKSIPATALIASDYVQRAPALGGGNVILVAYSRSGWTSETREAVAVFRERHPGGKAVVITCDSESGLAGDGDVSVAIPEAQETAVPQTRSTSSFWLFALLLAAREARAQARDDVNRAADAIEGIEARLWDEIRGAVDGFERTVLLGAGVGYALAHEGNLKVTEMSRRDSWAHQTMEFRHSALEVLDERALLIAPLGEPTPPELAAVEEAARFAGRTLDLPELVGLPQGAGAILGQLYALHATALSLAEAAGRNCDVLDRLQSYVEIEPLLAGSDA